MGDAFDIGDLLEISSLETRIVNNTLVCLVDDGEVGKTSVRTYALDGRLLQNLGRQGVDASELLTFETDADNKRVVVATSTSIDIFHATIGTDFSIVGNTAFPARRLTYLLISGNVVVYVTNPGKIYVYKFSDDGSNELNVSHELYLNEHILDIAIDRLSLVVQTPTGFKEAVWGISSEFSTLNVDAQSFVSSGSGLYFKNGNEMSIRGSVRKYILPPDTRKIEYAFNIQEWVVFVAENTILFYDESVLTLVGKIDVYALATIAMTDGVLVIGDGHELMVLYRTYGGLVPFDGTALINTMDYYEGTPGADPGTNSEKSVPEEDTDTDTDTDTWSTSSITFGVLKECANPSITSLEDYTPEDDPIRMWMPGTTSNGRASCTTVTEFKDYLRSDIDVFPPTTIMTIMTTPRDHDSSGYGGKTTGRLVVKLPSNGMFVTLGSTKRILTSPERDWHLVPMFNGKRRRIGNLGGQFGASMNHGQLPGFVVYKAFTTAEMDSGTSVREDPDDFLFDNSADNSDTLVMDAAFTNNVIKDLLESGLEAPVTTPVSSTDSLATTESSSTESDNDSSGDWMPGPRRPRRERDGEDA